MTREAMLERVRTALGRRAGDTPEAPPPVRLASLALEREEAIRRFTAALEALNGKVYRAPGPAEAREQVSAILTGRAAVVSRAPVLGQIGITGLPGVCPAPPNPEQFREICTNVAAGITSAHYALADTGSLVLLGEFSESRLVSLLPPCHIAVVPCDRLLRGLDELFTVLPDPAKLSSSMVLVTGPSRTGDIEMILVRGVHGPGEVHVVLLDQVT